MEEKMDENAIVKAVDCSNQSEVSRECWLLVYLFW
jgi:hypothetical protein